MAQGRGVCSAGACARASCIICTPINSFRVADLSDGAIEAAHGTAAEIGGQDPHRVSPDARAPNCAVAVSQMPSGLATFRRSTLPVTASSIS